MTDADYVLKSLAGDREAYGQLVDAYQTRVFAIALSITGNYCDSQDITQEVFLRAYRKLRTLSKASNFGKWLYSISKRLSVSFLRKKNLRLRAEVAAVEQASSNGISGAEMYARKEFSSLVQKQVNMLPQKLREAILLYYMEGFSTKDAASFLGITEVAMRKRLYYGRAKIRENLNEKIAAELRQYKPSRKMHNTILAALPAGGVPKIGLLGSLATKGALTMAAISAKKAAIIAVAIVIAITTITILNRTPKSGPVAPLHKIDKSVEKTTKTAEPVADVLPDTTTIADINNTPASKPEIKTAISGHVFYDDTREPAPDADVIIYQGRLRFRRVKTDENGQYKARFSSGVTILDMCARKDDLASEKITSLVIEPNEKTEDIDFYLQEGAIIAGKIIHRSDKQPIADCKVTIGRKYDYYLPGETTPYNSTIFTNSGGFSSGRDYLSDQTDTEGYFMFSGIPAGEYVCYGAGSKHYPKEVNVKLGEIRDDLVIELNTTTIFGTLINRDGIPLKGAGILLEVTDSNINYVNKMETWTTDDDGSFVFEYCPSGKEVEYKINAFVFKSGPSDKIDTNSVKINVLRKVPIAAYAYKQFTIGEDEDVFEINLIVYPKFSELEPGARVSGKVTDQDGTPIEGSEVILSHTNSPRGLHAYTDSNGIYEFFDIQDGKCFIGAVADGYKRNGSRIISIKDGEDMENVDFVLSPPEKKHNLIRLVHGDGSPVSSQGLLVYGESVRTDRNGLIVNYISEDRSSIQPNEKNKTLRIELEALYLFTVSYEPEQKYVTLTIEDPGALSGKVVHSSYESPAKKFSIKAVRGGHTHVDKAFTSETGEFYIDALQPGEYEFNFSAEIDGKTLKGTLDAVKVEPDAITKDIRVFLSE